jgi:hypothetical protein
MVQFVSNLATRPGQQEENTTKIRAAFKAVRGRIVKTFGL